MPSPANLPTGAKSFENHFAPRNDTEIREIVQSEDGLLEESVSHTAKLWSRDFILAIVSRGLSSIVFMLLSATLATYATSKYSVGADVAGSAVGVFIIACLISRVLAGHYIDIWGRRRSLIIAGFFFSAFSACYLFPINIGQLIVLRTLHGLAFGVSSTVINVVATSYIPQERLGEGLGFLSLSTPLSTAIGPFAGIVLMQAGNYKAMFLACAILSFVGFTLSIPLRIQEIKCPPEQTRRRQKIVITDFIETKALPVSLVVGLQSICIACTTSFVNGYATEEGLSAVAPWYFAVNATIMALMRPSLGKLMDRKGENTVIYPSIAALALGLFLLALPLTPITLLLASGAIAVGNGGIFPCIQAIAVRGLPNYRIGVAVSTLYVISDLGLGLGPTIGGIIANATGYPCLYLAAGILAFLLLPFYYLMHGRSA